MGPGPSARNIQARQGVACFFQAARRRATSLPPVQFTWTPAHCDINSVLHDPEEVERWLGNAWADFFAKVGASHHLVSQTLSQSVGQALQKHKKVLQFIAWSCQKVIVSQQWGRDAPPVGRPPEMRAPVVFGRRDDHELWFSGALNMWKCRRCGRSASTESTLALIRVGSGRLCAPTAIQVIATSEFFSRSRSDWALAVDARVAAPLAAAARLQGEGPEEAQVPPEPPSGGPPQQLQPDETLQDGSSELIAELAGLGHDVFCMNSVYCCRRCAGTMTIANSQSARKLRRVCSGLSENPSTRAGQLWVIDRVQRGLPPRGQSGGKASSPTI